MLCATRCGSSAVASADQPLPQHDQGPEAQWAAMLAQQLDESAEVLLEVLQLDSDVQLRTLLEAPASKGRHELLAAMLRRLEQHSSSGSTRAVPFPPPILDLSDAWLTAAEKGHARCLGVILDIYKQRPAALKELLEESGIEGDTALMLAAMTAEPGQLECMRLLLEHSPDAQLMHAGSGEHSALMYATEHDNPAAMQLFLAHSPEQQVAAKSWNGRTALTIAASEGHAACLQLLLAHSPEQQVAAMDVEGRNALMLAASCGSAPCLHLLLAHSPDAQLAVESWGENALSAAARFLLGAKARCATAGSGSSGAHQNATAGGSGSGAHQSLVAAGRECVELLLSHGAQLPGSANAEVRGVVWPIVQEAVRRARVPDMANAAVVGLALAAAAGAARDQPKGRRAALQGVLPYQKLLAPTPDLLWKV